MSLLPAYYTTNRMRKPKVSSASTKAKQDHEEWLRRNGVHPEQLKSKKKVRVTSNSSNVSNVSTSTKASELMALGPTGLKKDEKVYTGKEIIGVAVLHKSCLQPVRTKEAAADIAKMRR